MGRLATGDGWRATLSVVVRSAAEHRVPPMAGEAAFFAALAVFPALLTVVALIDAAGDVLGPGVDAAAVGGLSSLLRLVLTDRGGSAADAAVELLTGSTHGVVTAASAVALLLTVRALRSILYGLGTIADGPRRRLLAAVLLAVVLLGGGSVVVALTVVDPFRIAGLPVWRFLRWPILAAALFGWALLLLRVGLGRSCRCGTRVLAAGALVSTVGWFGASGLLSLYVALASRFTPTLGALGGGLILLVWLYLLTLALYLGAEVCRAVGEGEARPTP